MQHCQTHGGEQRLALSISVRKQCSRVFSSRRNQTSSITPSGSEIYRGGSVGVTVRFGDRCVSIEVSIRVALPNPKSRACAGASA
jgi:hypothetical protein